LLKRSHALFGLVAGWAVAAQAQTPTRPTESAQAAASDAASVSTVPTKSVKSAAPLVAVMAFEGRQVSADEAQILSEALAAEMSRSGEVRLMERSQMDKILAEQGFQNSGACSGTECAVEVGQILGIDRMVVGSVGHIGKTFVLSARMVNVGTGEVFRSSSRQAQGEIDQILTSLVPQVAQELLGRSPENRRIDPPPTAQFSSPPPPEVWSDSMMVVWQAADDKSLAAVRVRVARVDRPDSIVAETFRAVRGTLANGTSLLRFPAKMDSGTYVLTVVAEDNEKATGSSQVYFERKIRLAKSRSTWGWWVVGGLVVSGGAGGAYYLSQQSGGGSSPPASRSFTVTW